MLADILASSAIHVGELFWHDSKLCWFLYAFWLLQGRRHRGGGGGAGGATAPLKVSKKEKKLKYGVFSCIKISFSVIFNKEIHALRGLLSRF